MRSYSLNQKKRRRQVTSRAGGMGFQQFQCKAVSRTKIRSRTFATEEVRTWLEKHPRFKLRFTPTSASWLNVVESWFGILERRSVRRGAFKNVKEPQKEIRRFIKARNKYSAKSFVWTKPATLIIEKVHRARNKLAL